MSGVAKPQDGVGTAESEQGARSDVLMLAHIPADGSARGRGVTSVSSLQRTSNGRLADDQLGGE